MKHSSVLLLLALAASSLAWGDALDLPARVARLSYVEGAVAFHGAGERAPSALPDRPLMPGDGLTTGRDGRAELAFGTAVIRLDQDTALSVLDLDAATIRVSLDAGTASLHLHELLEDETFEIATPNATIAFMEPGEYRVDAAANDTTEFTVHAGAAEVTTAGGIVRVADGQRVRLAGHAALASLATPRAADAFDEWVLERELQFAQAEPPRYTPYEGNPYEELDQYGEWYDEPSYGRVWMPSYAYGGYDPFRYGRWERIGYGWGWVGSMPWSAHTFHYGRWAYLNHLNRWCWVPARHDHRRYVARDTRPYGRPRDDARARNDRRDPRPDYRGRQNDDERTTPATRSDGQPRRLHPAGAPTFRPDADSAKPRGGTMVPTPNRNRAPRPQSAPAPAPQPSAAPTARPSRPAEPRPAETRREAPARPAPTTIDREAGTRHTP